MSVWCDVTHQPRKMNRKSLILEMIIMVSVGIYARYTLHGSNYKSIPFQSQPHYTAVYLRIIIVIIVMCSNHSICLFICCQHECTLCYSIKDTFHNRKMFLMMMMMMTMAYKIHIRITFWADENPENLVPVEILCFTNIIHNPVVHIYTGRMRMRMIAVCGSIKVLKESESHFSYCINVCICLLSRHYYLARSVWCTYSLL